MKLNGINVVYLYVQDLAKQRKFYEQGFDLGKPVIDAKWWVEYAAGSGSHFALQQAEPARFEGVNRAKGTVKFSFDVADIKKMTETLKGLGAKFHYEPRQEYGFWLAEFEDPEGNVLRLYEKLKNK